jgi:hypothetical protein
MDAQPATATAPAPIRMAVTPAPGGLLEQLLDQQRAAKAAADEAEERVKSIGDRIKAELTQAHPGVAAFDIAGSQHRPAMHLTWVETARLDTRLMRREDPVLYVKYARFGGHWVLSPVRGGLG